jgi:magnesium transporter
MTAGEVRGGLEGGRFEIASHVVVLEGDRVSGLVKTEDLLAAGSGTRLERIMTSGPPTVTLDADEDVAAHVMADTRSGCLVVVAPDGAFQGLVSAEQMFELLLAEHDEDLARIGGYLAGSSRSMNAARESVRKRLWHRLPWLLLGLAGAMGSAVIMGAFDQTLEENVLVALFVPAIVYMSGAVGAQTQTVLIRAFAAGVTTRMIVAREMVTGAVVGLVVGLAFYGFALLGWGDGRVALAVGIALFASATIATAVAMVLPSLFERFGADPAFGSGPLATLIQDLLSITTYFAAVILIVT